MGANNGTIIGTHKRYFLTDNCVAHNISPPQKIWLSAMIHCLNGTPKGHIGHLTITIDGAQEDFVQTIFSGIPETFLKGMVTLFMRDTL